MKRQIVKQIMPNPLKQRLVIYSIVGEEFDSESVEIFECPVIGLIQSSLPQYKENEPWTEVVPLVFDAGEYITAYELMRECESFRSMGIFDESYSRSKLIQIAEQRHKQALIIRKMEEKRSHERIPN